VRRITGQLRFVIEPEVIDHVRYRLIRQRGITDVNKVTWDVVSDVLHDLAKRVDPKFSDYYQHVYQITNIIRGSPILKLTSEQEQELYNMFDVIYDMWENYKQSDRSNFMSNALALQLCFYILDYPEYTISMFNMLKGSDNLRNYDRICEKICIDLGKEPIKTSTIANMKSGVKGSNIMAIMKQKKEEAQKLKELEAQQSTTESNIMQTIKEKREIKNNTNTSDHMESTSTNSKKRKADEHSIDEESYSLKKVKEEPKLETVTEYIVTEPLEEANQDEEEWEWVEEEVEVEVNVNIAEPADHSVSLGDESVKSTKRKNETVESTTPVKKTKIQESCVLLDD
jgi:hypothetical protein